MNEEELNEQEQMRKLMTFRKIAQGIVCRHIILLSLAFIAVFVSVAGLIARKVSRSGSRYEASTMLIFTPKNSSKIKSMENQEVLQVITRYAMFKKLADVLQLSPAERARIAVDITVEQERAQKNLFRIIAHSADEESAVRKVNAFADLCLREYASYRTGDLERWLETILLRKREILESIEKNDAEESALCRKYGVTKPLTEAERLTVAISERKAELSEAKVQLGGCELKRKKIAAELDKIPSAAVSHIEEIRRYMSRLVESEKAIAELSRQYTDKNPRLQLRNEQYAREKADLQELLESIGVSNESLPSFDRMGSLLDSLRDAEAKTELVREGVSAIEREIERLTKQLGDLLVVMPEFDRLSHQRDNLRNTLESVEDDISDVRYLESSVRNDLSQVERAQFAVGAKVLSSKAIAVALILGLAFSGMLAFLIVLIEFSFGKVLSVGEISCQDGLFPLGALPTGGVFTDPAEEKAVLDGIFYRFKSAEKDWGSMFVALLPGAEAPKSLASSFEWNFAMCGLRMLTIRIVPAQGFVEPDGAELLGGVVRTSQEAWFPVADISAMSPGELSLLNMDVKALRKSGCAVCLFREQPIRRGELIASQLADLCDSIAIAVGVNRTRREDLRHILALSRRHPERKVPVLMTGVDNPKSLKEGNYR